MKPVTATETMEDEMEVDRPAARGVTKRLAVLLTIGLAGAVLAAYRFFRSKNAGEDQEEDLP